MNYKPSTTRNRKLYYHEVTQVDRGWWPILIIAACISICMVASACQPRDTGSTSTFMAHNG